MLERRFKLASSVIKKSEEKLNKFCFYNAKNKSYWNSDLSLGSVISVLDGTLTVAEILDIIISNNIDVDSDALKETLLEAFKVLYEGEFLTDVVE